jgi:hypothetical protein
MSLQSIPFEVLEFFGIDDTRSLVLLCLQYYFQHLLRRGPDQARKHIAFYLIKMGLLGNDLRLFLPDHL